MFEATEDILNIFNLYVKQYGGELLEIFPNKIYQVQNQGYSITHFVGDRDTSARFIVSIPLILNKEAKFSIKKKTIFNEALKKVNIFSELVVLEDGHDYYIRVLDNDFSKQMVKSLMNDFTYLPYLDRLEKARITYANQTLSVYINANASNQIASTFINRLNELVELCHQTKTALEFYDAKF